MKRRFGPSLYFANDKVIFDAMNHARVTMDQIRELLFERNIVVSAKTSKYDLAQYFSRLPADYFDHKAIAGKIGKVAQRERITYTEITNSVTRQEIIEGLQAVKNKVEESSDVLEIDVQPDRIVAIFSYEHIDYTQVEFRQVQPRDAVIEILKNEAGNFVIRSSQNKYADSVVDETFAAINSSRTEKIGARRLTLTGFPDPVKRTEFFNKLIGGIQGHSLVTVTEAYCYKPQSSAASSSDSDSESEDDDGAEKSLEDQPFVERISLKGKGVTKSFVIDELYEKGYYIVKVVWHVKANESMDSDIFELEAQFSEPKDCTDFSYQTRCVVICEDGKPTKKKRTPKLAEDDAMFRLIENAAKAARDGLEM